MPELEYSTNRTTKPYDKIVRDMIGSFFTGRDNFNNIPLFSYTNAWNELSTVYTSPIAKPELVEEYVQSPFTSKELSRVCFSGDFNNITEVFLHPAWEDNVVGAMKHHNINFTPTLAVIRAAQSVERLAEYTALYLEYKPYIYKQQVLGYGYYTPDEVKAWAVQNGYVSVAANPDTPMDAIEKAISQTSLDTPEEWKKAADLAAWVAFNPKATPVMLGWVGYVFRKQNCEWYFQGNHRANFYNLRTLLVQEFYKFEQMLEALANNPLSPPETLRIISALSRKDQLKTWLVLNPNLPPDMLAKYRRSTVPAVRNALAIRDRR